MLLAGAGLLRHWQEHEGGCGVQVGVDLRRRISWTVSLWDSDRALHRFLASPRHRQVVTAHRARVNVRAETYTTDAFDPTAAWAAALRLEGS
ncbi:MAG: hypothetical protein JOZ37_00590 [Actinobacteria bacterium]|nr:hypothetical protein [Actinomycetota bacterium]MBV9253008.1 hypothetical protein [Actinomycetota bacterium]MBV9662431.1 hypothetical protein [Actinomycetota bacterium]